MIVMRCQIKGRGIKSVRRLLDVFYCLLLFDQGICSRGEKAQGPIHIKGRLDALPSLLELDRLKWLKNNIYIFFKFCD